MISNQHVPVDALPPLEAVDYQRVPSRFAVYRGVVSALVAVPAWVIAVGWMLSHGEFSATRDIALSAFISIGVLLVLAHGVVEAGRRAYAIREHDVLYVSGLFTRRITVLPICRIQHVETVSGPLERLFGLERLVCYTAGGPSADLVLAGLRQETAKRIRGWLIRHIVHTDASGPNRDD